MFKFQESGGEIQAERGEKRNRAEEILSRRSRRGKKVRYMYVWRGRD
jgi:hypothetical protein